MLMNILIIMLNRIYIPNLIDKIINNYQIIIRGYFIYAFNKCYAQRSKNRKYPTILCNLNKCFSY